MIFSIQGKSQAAEAVEQAMVSMLLETTELVVEVVEEFASFIVLRFGTKTSYTQTEGKEQMDKMQEAEQ